MEIEQNAQVMAPQAAGNTSEGAARGRPKRLGVGEDRAKPRPAQDREQPKGKASWESILSSLLAVGTFIFGIYTWWDAKQQPRPAEEKTAAKIIVVTPPAGAGGASVAAVVPEASADPNLTPHVLTLSNGGRLSYYRNLALDETHPGVERAVIVVAGALVSHDGHLYQGLMEQARQEGRDRDTLVFVPVFRTSDKAPRPGDLQWGSTWETGGSSVTAGLEAISTFRVIDEVIGQITEARRFPSLRTVVVAGNNSGGTFVNRYVAGGQPIIAADARGPIKVEYLIMGATSYLYLDRNPGPARTFRNPL